MLYTGSRLTQGQPLLVSHLLAFFLRIKGIGYIAYRPCGSYTITAVKLYKYVSFVSMCLYMPTQLHIWLLLLYCCLPFSFNTCTLRLPGIHLDIYMYKCSIIRRQVVFFFTNPIFGKKNSADAKSRIFAVWYIDHRSPLKGYS